MYQIVISYDLMLRISFLFIFYLLPILFDENRIANCLYKNDFTGSTLSFLKFCAVES